jgi:hypothetical protein
LWSAHVILLFFFASPKRKVAKEKGDFLPKAPPAKNRYTLISKAIFSYMALAFCLSLTSI